MLSGKLPDDVATLDRLTDLTLSDNNLQGAIPIGIGDLIELEYLNLANNQLAGSIPESINENLSELRHLVIHNNRLGGIVSANICETGIQSLLFVAYFNIKNNRLVPPYPACIQDVVGEQDIYSNSLLDGAWIFYLDLSYFYILYDGYGSVVDFSVFGDI